MPSAICRAEDQSRTRSIERRFFFNPDVPQGREMYGVTVKVFVKHLGKE